MKTTSRLITLFVLLAALLAACQSPAPSAPTAAPEKNQLANPASENCLKVGDTLQIETDGAGNQFGVCYFEDNRQCEEWALLRGECPVGGRKVTGYVTPAARYCAILGGEYTVTGTGSGPENEQGTCKLPDARVCDVWELYNGKCAP